MPSIYPKSKGSLRFCGGRRKHRWITLVDSQHPQRRPDRQHEDRFPMRWHTFFLVAVFFFSSSAVGVGNATSGEIEFHTAAYSFPCRVKTPKEFAEANPDREIIEAIIRISATFDLHEKNINRVEYKLLFPESFEISDYLPKTTIGSEVVGQIQVGDQGMRKSMNIVSEDFGGKVSFQIPYVPIEGQKKSETKNETESEMRSKCSNEFNAAERTNYGGQHPRWRSDPPFQAPAIQPDHPARGQRLCLLGRGS